MPCDIIDKTLTNINQTPNTYIMNRKVFRITLFLALFFAGILSMSAQQQLPLNPKVKSGVLPNGLSYYILNNSEPKERANFYIAQKVGSTLETPEQLGLAHFLEHMAFNGTSNFPGKDMLNYLQGKGIRFGADINAYTGFDETVYNINNVPTTDQALMDSVLLVLHDWSGSISLLTEEIDAERGVIQEEWRSRNDAQSRMMTTILPKIYDEYQYEQMPIGKMDVVMNFDPDVLRAYYRKWYRPDLQGIVIVGDFDADVMEQKVKALFSDIPMPKDAAKREYPKVSDNKEPIYVNFSDPELQNGMVMIAFKSDPIPTEYRNTVEAYIQVDLLSSVISMLINNRLTEFASKPECRYAYAGLSIGDFLVSKTKDAVDITILPKSDVKGAVEDAMGIIARACKTGFTESEYQRVKDDILANYEKLYNERDKYNSEALGREIIRHFIDNEPSPGIEAEYQLVKQMLPMIPVDAINQSITGLLTAENQVIIETMPEKEGAQFVGQDVLVGVINNALSATYEAYVDEVITDPLIPQLPAPGKISSVEDNAAWGTTEFKLSNGIKVVVKTTDFAADEILFSAFREGGKQTYAQSEAPNVLSMGDAYELAKLGPFDHTTLKKYLAGKKVSLSFNVNNYSESLGGRSTVKDLSSLMELIYASFTALSADKQAFDVQIDQARTLLESQKNNPQKIFFDHVAKARYNNNALLNDIDVATLDAINYDRVMELLHGALKNAAEYTFIFTGNVDAATLRPLLEQYIATLPVGMIKKPAVVTNLNQVTGQVKDEWKQPMQSPVVMVYDVYSDNNLEVNVKNDILVSLLGDILGNVFTNTLREEEGGTYSPYAGAGMNPITREWQILYFFMTNSEQMQKLITRANDELLNLLNNGASADDFNKVKEAAIKQYEINSRTNGFWLSQITYNLRGHDLYTGYIETLRSITLNDLNAFMKSLYNGKNRIQVIMEGEQTK